MKRYTKPIVVKVVLNHEQAVLGTCSSGAVTKEGNASGWCKGSCKQSDSSAGANDTATS